jgi:hypothetical protein
VGKKKRGIFPSCICRKKKEGEKRKKNLKKGFRKGTRLQADWGSSREKKKSERAC